MADRGLGDWVWRGLLAPVRALLPKNPWLRWAIYLLPVLVVLWLLGPALHAVVELLRLLVALFEPLLQSTLGRSLLLLAVFAAGGLGAYGLLRHRVRDLRGEAVVGRHLRAVGALVGSNRRRSRDGFRRVARYRGPLPSGLEWLPAAANLALARLELEAARPAAALACLLRVVERDLPPELVRSLCQLRLTAELQQGALLPAALLAEAEAAVARFPDDAVLLGTLRDLRQQAGDPDGALEAHARLATAVAPLHAPLEQQHLATRIESMARQALAAGDHERARQLAKRLAKLLPDGNAAGLLLGDLHRSTGDLPKALQAYGRTRSAAGLERMAELLAAHPGCVEPRQLLEWCPLQGTLLLVARELARAGERERAERAARLAAEQLGPTPTVCAVLVEVLELLGEGEQAQRLRERTVARLLQAPPS
ncbi:MAG: hypothetical protein JNK49_07875 [Planctomycetes bacterium]|nr:hypothetical protein [Planctomycetota bacterium]